MKKFFIFLLVFTILISSVNATVYIFEDFEDTADDTFPVNFTQTRGTANWDVEETSPIIGNKSLQMKPAANGDWQFITHDYAMPVDDYCIFVIARALSNNAAPGVGGRSSGNDGYHGNINTGSTGTNDVNLQEMSGGAIGTVHDQANLDLTNGGTVNITTCISGTSFNTTVSLWGGAEVSASGTDSTLTSGNASLIAYEYTDGRLVAFDDFCVFDGGADPQQCYDPIPSDPVVSNSLEINKIENTDTIFINNPSFININSFNVTISGNKSDFLSTKITHEGSSSNTLTCQNLIDGGLYNTTASRSQNSGESGVLTLFTSPLNLSEGSHEVITQCKREGPGGAISVTNQQNFFYDWSVDLNFTYQDLDFSISNADLTETSQYTFRTSNNSNEQVILNYKIIFENTDTVEETAEILFAINNENCSNMKRGVSAGSSASISGSCMVKELSSDTEYNITLYTKGNSADITGKFYTVSVGLNSTEIQNQQITNQNISTSDFVKIANLSLTNINFDNENLYVGYFYSHNASSSGTLRTYVNVVGPINYTGAVKNISTLTQKRNSYIKELFTSVPTGDYSIEIYASCDNSDCDIDEASITSYMAGEVSLNSGDFFQVFVKDIFSNTSINTFNLTTTDGLTLFTENSAIDFAQTTGILNFTIQADGYADTETVLNITGLSNTTVYLYTTNSVNIIFKDEETLATLTNTTINLEFISNAFSLNDSTYNGTYYVDLLTPTSYTIRYDADGYDQRLYYLSLADRTTSNLTLYLLNSSSLTDVTATVYDTSNNGVEGAVIKVLKYDITENAYVIREMATTNNNGVASLNLVLNTEFYKFIIEKPSGNVELTTTPSYILSNSLNFQIVLGESTTNNYFQVIDTSYSLSYNNNTETFLYTFSDSTGTANKGCMEVYQITAASTTLLSNQCGSGSAGSVSYTINPVNASNFRAEAYIYYNNVENFLDQKLVGFVATANAGQLGLFLTFILVLAMLLLVTRSMALAAATLPLGFVVASYFGLLTVPFAVLIPAQIAGILLGLVLARD